MTGLVTARTWSAPGGDPATGGGTTFQTSFATAGLRMITLEACNGVACTERAESVTVQSTNASPMIPQTLTHWAAGAGLGAGAYAMTSTIEMRGTLHDSDGDLVTLEVEIRPVSAGLFEIPNCVPGPAVSSGSVATAICSNLGVGSYVWQARARDQHGAVGPWQWAGFADAGQADIHIVNPAVFYWVHVGNLGDQPSVTNGGTAGTPGANQLEEITINLDGLPATATIQYRVHGANYGWTQGWRSGGEAAGTRTLGLDIQAIEIVLQNAPGLSVQYRVFPRDQDWTDWACDGAQAGTTREARPLQAIEIRIVPASACP